MSDTSTTNGAGPGAAAEAAAAGHEDQGGVAELGFVAGERASREAPGRGVPDPELVEQAKRRTFTAKYKARILAEADACTAPGEVGELLRREGLYTSHLTYWRKAAQGRCASGARQAARPQAGRQARRRDRGADTAGRARGSRARESPEGHRDPGETLSAVGGDARYRERAQEHRAMIAQTVEELTPLIGTRPACRALGASVATVYRRRQPPAPPRPARPRSAPERALSQPERARVLEVLASERFVDVAPEEIWATLLDEGTYLCSTRTMYRILKDEYGRSATAATS